MDAGAMKMFADAGLPGRETMPAGADVGRLLKRALRDEVRPLGLACQGMGLLVWLTTLAVTMPGMADALAGQLLCTAAAAFGVLLSLVRRPAWALHWGSLIAVVALAWAFRLSLRASEAPAVWALPLLLLFGMCLALCHVRVRDFLLSFAVVGAVFLDGTLVASVPQGQRPLLALFLAFAFLMCLLTNVALLRERRAGHLLRLQMGRLAYEDVLTGLANRRAFFEAANAAIAAAPQGRFSLVLLDVDDFKRINDRFGHEAGDQALVAVAGALRRASAPHLCARLGGEEFCVWIDDEAVSPPAVARACVSGVHQLQVAGLRLSISAGVATVEPDVPLGRALALADEALYQAKARGKDTLAVAPPSGRMPLIVPPQPERRSWRPWRPTRRD